MGKKFKIKYVKLNRRAIKEEILKGAGVGVCKGLAKQLAQEAGPGYETFPVFLRDRSGEAFYPATEEAKKDNYENNTLEKIRSAHTYEK